MTKKIARLAGLPYELDTVQSRIADNVDSLAALPINDGRLVQDIDLLMASSNNVEHKLGRQPLGYFIALQDAQADIWSTAQTANFLTLSCSADVTVSLWVF